MENSFLFQPNKLLPLKTDCSYYPLSSLETPATQGKKKNISILEKLDL